MTVDVDRIPRRVLTAGTPLYRIHGARYSPWFFSSGGVSRFDPIAASGRGACYWAEHPLGAWVESFRTRMLLSEDEVRLQSLSSLELTRPVVVIDLADRRALAAGVTVALTAGADYAESQAIASMLQGLVAGVRWRVRHDLAQELIGVALFGPRGSHADAELGHATTARIGPQLIRAAEDAFGYCVLPLSAR